MSTERTTIDVNLNFHHIAGEDLFRKGDSQFKKYRKKWEEWPKNFYVGKFPLFIDIEVTNDCNLRCSFCHVTSRRKNIRKGTVSFGIVKKIIDEGAGEGLCGVKFNIRGEPLLHPQIHEFVKYAKQKGLIDVYFNTNAMLLSESVSKKLIEAGLDRISISFEGFTKEVYEKYRINANYERVLSNIENLRILKKKYGVEYPKIRVQSVRLPDIKDMSADYKKFWSERVDEVAFIDYQEVEKKERLRYPWACPQIWQRMGIWWDGTMLPCNHDFDTLLSLGNVKDVLIKEAWHSEKLNHIRDSHKEGKAHEVSACDTCYIRNSEILSLIKRQGKV